MNNHWKIARKLIHQRIILRLGFPAFSLEWKLKFKGKWLLTVLLLGECSLVMVEISGAEPANCNSSAWLFLFLAPKLSDLSGVSSLVSLCYFCPPPLTQPPLASPFTFLPLIFLQASPRSPLFFCYVFPSCPEAPLLSLSFFF